MPYLIDGHNLIPKLGLRLDQPDDEMELVRLLQDFARIRRQLVEVYFDGAPAGQAGMRKLGIIKAHFIRQGQTADSAVRRRLEAMGNSAKNWTIISSDHEVLGLAKAHHAAAMRSEEFVRQLRETLSSPMPNPSEDVRKPLSSKEVEEWLNVFNRKTK
ncbi:MAG: NYN domain-containing protein [Chloroflexi bacterium]|nr:NYN domain-containing protein [Chloroflexota bacterium]